MTVAVGVSAGGMATPFSPAAIPTPEAELNILGKVNTKPAPDGSIVGFVDAHTHLMSNLGFGGNLHCGATYSTKGIADALKDCESHKNGISLVENVTKVGGAKPFAKHDTNGYPNFAYWPSATSLTHQQMYYRWVERSWRTGQRVMVVHAVNNNILCKLPTQVNTYSCDDMDTVRRQIKATKELQAFIDKQYGGPGKGWFRIVYSSAEAQAVARQGKLAVILGVEVSNPFGCGLKYGKPQCTTADIDRGLDEMYALGVRSMFLCHKFDNALCGVRFDSGTQGIAVNAGNWLNTGEFWNVEKCTGPVPDNTVSGGVLPDGIAKLLPIGTFVPIYPKGPHCNVKGLSKLGEYMLDSMMKKSMMIEIDHMSAKAADKTLKILAERRYAGVISSHSWMAPEYRERLYQIGGFSTQYGFNSRKFVKEMNAEQKLRQKYRIGYGVGMDMNGFGGTPTKRKGNEENPVVYPFTSADGSHFVQKQRTGNRLFDINKEGVSHYGMVPDYLEDIRKVGGDAAVAELMRGADSYLKVWGRAEGVTAPAQQPVAAAQKLAAGTLATAPATTTPVAAQPKAHPLSIQSANASSTHLGFFGLNSPKHTIDEDTKTRWRSRWSPWATREVIEYDLGSSQSIGSLDIRWGAGYATKYWVNVSDDGKNWKLVRDVKTGDGSIDTHQLKSVSARYIRIEMAQRISGENHYEIAEVTAKSAPK